MDKPTLIVTTTALLTLASASFLCCPTARATTPPPAPQASPAPPAAYDDGDGGDELLEHWGDPKYAREERLQIVGMSVLLAGMGFGGWHRRHARRKAVRHD